MLIRDLGAEVLVCTPSYALHIAEVARRGSAPETCRARIGHFGGEPWTEEMRVTIERELIRAFNNYGLSEVVGPGVSASARTGPACTCRRITSSSACDPDTLAHVPDGEASSCSRRSRSRRCRCCATAPATSPRSIAALPVRAHRRAHEPGGGSLRRCSSSAA